MHVSASLAWISKWTLWIKTLTRIWTQMFSVEFTTLESITITHIQLSSNCSGITEENFHLEMERLAGTPL